MWWKSKVPPFCPMFCVNEKNPHLFGFRENPALFPSADSFLFFSVFRKSPAQTQVSHRQPYEQACSVALPGWPPETFSHSAVLHWLLLIKCHPTEHSVTTAEFKSLSSPRASARCPICSLPLSHTLSLSLWWVWSSHILYHSLTRKKKNQPPRMCTCLDMLLTPPAVLIVCDL